MPIDRQDLLQKENVSLWFEPTRIEVAAAGDMAYELGRYALAFETPDGGVRDRGKYLIVWQKRDGEWKVVADSPNSDGPPPP